MTRRYYHGTNAPEMLKRPLPPARDHHWWSRSDWRTYDRWIGMLDIHDAMLPYANHVWLELGLQEKDRSRAPEALRQVRSFKQLEEAVSILFVTDAAEHAQRYGTVFEVDPDACGAIKMIDDPNIQSANAWIMVVPRGATILKEDRG